MIKDETPDTSGPTHTFEGHSDIVHSVAFSPGDGTLLASASKDATIKLWNVRSRRLVHTVKGHSKWVNSVAFSPGDGALLASASDDKTIKLWDVRSRRLVHTFEGHSDEVALVAFSPADGALLASVSSDNTIKLWDVQSLRLVHTFEGHSQCVWSVAFSPADGGALLASGSWDKTIKLWDVRSRRLVHTCKGHSHWVRSLAFSPADGALLASASHDRTIKLWDVRSRRLVHTFEGHSNYVISVAFSPGDGAWLASASCDTTIKLWDVRSRRLAHTFEGHSNYVFLVAFSPSDGALLASASFDNTIKLWTVPNQMPAFFEALVRADREAWSSEKTLECLAPKVSDIAELKLFYTGAAAACRNDDITVDERNRMIHDVLEEASRAFRFDREARVATTLKLVIQKAKDDGVLEEEEAVRLDRLAERNDTLSDERFVDLAERVARLEKGFENLTKFTVGLAQYARVVEDQATAAMDYAQHVDERLLEFKRQYGKHLKRKAAVSTLAAVVGALTMGVGFGIVGAVDDACQSVVNKVIDFSDTRHVLCTLRHVSGATLEAADLALLVAEEKLDDWMNAPLHKAVVEHKIEASHVRAAAMIKTLIVCNADAPRVEASDDEPTVVAATDDEPTVVATTGPAFPTAKAAFVAMKRELGVDAAATSVPFDDDFVTAFEVCFEMDFDVLDDEVRVAFEARFARGGRTCVTELTWKKFHQCWARSGLSMEAYVVSLAAPS